MDVKNDHGVIICTIGEDYTPLSHDEFIDLMTQARKIEQPHYEMVEALHTYFDAQKELREAKDKVRKANLVLIEYAVNLGLNQEFITHGASAADFVNGYLYGKGIKPKE
jgi:hypothetical protein